ncbi:ribbon-helix-helix protein, CopG family [Natronobeatus ordinarius]|uniref:ribbon-helix-helix protein, CopG family n=1 Tax=Natronobeatus ordinarius TaxID=2963433 RepID=UPI0020CC428D|nr:ribbon-helix-helix protein, CopG family [Natronobeatus ordinarius]
MEPITLRLQPDLLDDLDDEADEAGFSSRSEYIRHLLMNRPSISQGVTTGIDTATSDTETVDTLVVQVEELTEHVTGLEERITDLEDDVDDDSSPADLIGKYRKHQYGHSTRRFLTRVNNS